VWWVAYRWGKLPATELDFFHFIFILLAPVILYLMAVLLFPDEIKPGTDMRAHFESVRKWFFTLLAVLPLVDMMDTLLKGWQHFIDQGVMYWGGIVFMCGASLMARVHTSRRRNASFAILFLSYLLIFIGLNLRTLV
jgi:hypothetical protein